VIAAWLNKESPPADVVFSAEEEELGRLIGVAAIAGVAQAIMQGAAEGHLTVQSQFVGAAQHNQRSAIG
jgi:hypothetical protein